MHFPTDKTVLQNMTAEILLFEKLEESVSASLLSYQSQCLLQLQVVFFSLILKLLSDRNMLELLFIMYIMKC